MVVSSTPSLPARPVLLSAARGEADLMAVTALFREFAAWLDLDVLFPDFESELANLPGRYAPPAGELLLARHPDGRAAGCVAMRPLAWEGACELNRLWVCRDARGLGLGRALVKAIVTHAGAIGYREMRLATLTRLRSAGAAYRACGFVPAPPHDAVPMADVEFLGRLLEPLG